VLSVVVVAGCIRTPAAIEPKDLVRRLFEARADIFRINMSHTSHDQMRELVATIRNVESGNLYDRSTYNIQATADAHTSPN